MKYWSSVDGLGVRRYEPANAAYVRCIVVQVLKSYDEVAEGTSGNRLLISSRYLALDSAPQRPHAAPEVVGTGSRWDLSDHSVRMAKEKVPVKPLQPESD
jgi:hypothetical protein